MVSRDTPQVSVNLILDRDLYQLITSPAHNAGNMLDLILINNDQKVQDVVIHQTLPSGLSSDHFIITFKIFISHSSKI